MPVLLSARAIEKGYPTGTGDRLEVLSGASVSVMRGELVAIVGESGTGKSTLLHILGALDRPDAGQVLYRGEDIFNRKDRQLARFRNESVGFIFQFHHLLPEFTAMENVAMPALIRGSRMGVACERAQKLLDQVGLADRLSHRPSELSGGEQQRVAVARALMNEPDLVLADEPTGNLDAKNAAVLHKAITTLREAYQQTFVIVTHNPVLAEICDRVLVLKGGQVHEDGTNVPGDL